MLMKVCKKCGRELPASKDYFYKEPTTIDGFQGSCKECGGHKFTNKLKAKKGFKICDKCGKEKPATLEYFTPNQRRPDEFKSSCKDCVKIYNNQYREKYKKEITERKKEYAKSNRDKVRKLQKHYRQQNKEKCKQYAKKYLIKNKEKIHKYKKHYREENKEKINKQLAQYRKENPEKIACYRQKRRAEKKQLMNSLTYEQWGKIKERFNCKCAYCGQEKPLEREHFIPLSKGGEYTHNNIVPSCKVCNSSKGAKDFFEWYPKYKYYSKKREKNILEFLNYKDDKMQQLALI